MSTSTLVPLEVPDIPVIETYRDSVKANRARLSDMLTSGKFVQAVRSWSLGDSNCFVNLAYSH